MREAAFASGDAASLPSARLCDYIELQERQDTHAPLPTLVYGGGTSFGSPSRSKVHFVMRCPASLPTDRLLIRLLLPDTGSEGMLVPWSRVRTKDGKAPRPLQPNAFVFEIVPFAAPQGAPGAVAEWELPEKRGFLLYRAVLQIRGRADAGEEVLGTRDNIFVARLRRPRNRDPAAPPLRITVHDPALRPGEPGYSRVVRAGMEPRLEAEAAAREAADRERKAGSAEGQTRWEPAGGKRKQGKGRARARSEDGGQAPGTAPAPKRRKLPQGAGEQAQEEAQPEAEGAGEASEAEQEPPVPWGARTEPPRAPPSVSGNSVPGSPARPRAASVSSLASTPRHEDGGFVWGAEDAEEGEEPRTGRDRAGSPASVRSASRPPRRTGPEEGAEEAERRGRVGSDRRPAADQARPETPQAEAVLQQAHLQPVPQPLPPGPHPPLFPQGPVHIVPFGRPPMPPGAVPMNYVPGPAPPPIIVGPPHPVPLNQQNAQQLPTPTASKSLPLPPYPTVPFVLNTPIERPPEQTDSNRTLVSPTQDAAHAVGMPHRFAHHGPGPGVPFVAPGAAPPPFQYPAQPMAQMIAPPPPMQPVFPAPEPPQASDAVVKTLAGRQDALSEFWNLAVRLDAVVDELPVFLYQDRTAVQAILERAREEAQRLRIAMGEDAYRSGKRFLDELEPGVEKLLQMAPAKGPVAYVDFERCMGQVPNEIAAACRKLLDEFVESYRWMFDPGEVAKRIPGPAASALVNATVSRLQARMGELWQDLDAVNRYYRSAEFAREVDDGRFPYHALSKAEVTIRRGRLGLPADVLEPAASAVMWLKAMLETERTAAFPEWLKGKPAAEAAANGNGNPPRTPYDRIKRSLPTVVKVYFGKADLVAGAIAQFFDPASVERITRSQRCVIAKVPAAVKPLHVKDYVKMQTVNIRVIDVSGTQPRNAQKVKVPGLEYRGKLSSWGPFGAFGDRQDYEFEYEFQIEKDKVTLEHNLEGGHPLGQRGGAEILRRNVASVLVRLWVDPYCTLSFRLMAEPSTRWA